MLAPGTPDDFVQFIDVRDLAQWIVHAAQARLTGIYDGIGPALTRGQLLTECAAALATSRRRYSAIERGEVAVSAAELELLMEYLEIPAHLLWQGERSPSGIHHLVVQAPPGKTVQVVVKVQG